MNLFHDDPSAHPHCHCELCLYHFGCKSCNIKESRFKYGQLVTIRSVWTARLTAYTGETEICCADLFDDGEYIVDDHIKHLHCHCQPCLRTGCNECSIPPLPQHDHTREECYCRYELEYMLKEEMLLLEKGGDDLVEPEE